MLKKIGIALMYVINTAFTFILVMFVIFAALHLTGILK